MANGERRAGGTGEAMLLRRIGRNAGIILGGRTVAAGLNLAAAAVAVRAVGLEAFGMVAMLQAFTRVLAGVLRFESWATVTRFGAGLLAEGRDEDLRRLTGLTLRLDVIAFALALAGAWLAAPLIGPWLGWSDAITRIAPIYALSMLFITHATPTGFLRLLGRFAPLALQNAMNAALRLAGALGVLSLGGGALALAGVWAMAGVLSGGWLTAMAWREARRRGLLPRLGGSWSALAEGFPGIRGFLLSTNATALLDTLVAHGTTMAVGGGLGPAGASLVALTRQLTDAVQKLGALLGPVIFPEIAALEAGGERRRAARLLWRGLMGGTLTMAALVLALAAGGEALLALLFGDPARAGAPLLVAAGAAAGLHVATFALAPFLLSVGRERAVLLSAAAALAVYAPALALLMPSLGLLGVGLALLLHQAVMQGLRLVSACRAAAEAPAR